VPKTPCCFASTSPPRSNWLLPLRERVLCNRCQIFEQREQEEEDAATGATGAARDILQRLGGAQVHHVLSDNRNPGTVFVHFFSLIEIFFYIDVWKMFRWFRRGFLRERLNFLISLMTMFPSFYLI
jgi:hypothetical protein